MKYRTLNGPISAQIEITELCNLDCVHCYNHWRDGAESAKLASLDEAGLDKITDVLIVAGVSSVTLTGGEPLLFWRILPRAIQKLTSSSIYVSLNSNLNIFSDEIAYALELSGLKNILVSVLSSREDIHDSITGRNGSLAKTVAGIKKAVEFGFRVSSNTVLTKANFRYLRETAELMKRLGVVSFCATKASPALNSKDFSSLSLSREDLRFSLGELVRIKNDLNIPVDILECYPMCLIADMSKYSFFARHSCSAGVTTCTVSPLGDVRPCSHADIVYGNIFREEFLEIWKKMEDWRNGSYIPDECNECRFVQECTGGCRMEAKYHGNIKGRDPFMSGPEDVKPAKLTKGVMVIPDRLKINPLVKIREEEFGATVSIPGNALLLNFDATLIVRYLLEISDFDTKRVAGKFEAKIEDVERLLQRLLKSGMVLSAINAAEQAR